MKVSVVTLHHVRNYGSMLQTYATQHILEKLGCEAEIIDYIPRGLTLKYGILTIKNQGNFVKDLIRKAGASIVFTTEQLTMINFLKKHVTLSKKSYSCFEDLKNDCPEADVYLAGSDQIWNTQNYNLPDDVRGYYLDFVPEGKTKIAYASSIGKDSFSEEEKGRVKGYLESFNAISVRENSAVGMLEDIGISGAKHVLDPTLLINKDEWMEFLKNNRKTDLPQKPYVFVYNLNRNAHVKNFALKLAQKKNLEVINFADTLDFMSGAKNLIHNTVFDFLYYLANASYVVTDSFHGTAFSINLGKQFVSFCAPRFNSRLNSILGLFGLEHRLQSEFSGDISLCDDVIDYNIVSKRLDEERQESLSFLKNSLSL